MSTPYNYIETTGIITADVSDFQAQVIAEWQTANGADIATTADTYSGKQINAEVTARSRVAQMMAMLANMINPNNAGGVFLDAICAFLGLARDEATYTVVPNCALGGTPNFVLAAGAMQAIDKSTGYTYVNTLAIQFAADGTATSDFQCQTAGAIECDAGALSIATQVLGWETISNASAGTPGELEQSDTSLRAERNNTLAKQGISTVEAQVSDLYAVAGVNSLAFRENITSATAVIDGITLKAHSVWACVDGGADIDIATSLLNNKTDGADWNGATDVAVVEPNSGQTYTVLFDRPTVLGVLAQVQIRQGTSSADLPSAVPAAVVAYASGEVSGDPGFVVGGQVSPFDIAAGIAAQLPGVMVKQVLVAFAGVSPVFGATELAIALNQKASITLSGVQVTVVT